MTCPPPMWAAISALVFSNRARCWIPVTHPTLHEHVAWVLIQRFRHGDATWQIAPGQLSQAGLRQEENWKVPGTLENEMGRREDGA